MVYEIRYEASSDITNAKKKESDEAREMIEEEAPTFIDKNSRPKTLVKGELVRLDLQGLFNRPDGKRYANLQIQLNKPRYSELEEQLDESQETEDDQAGATAEVGKPKSTTIAIVLMPAGENIPENISRQAFEGSLNNREKAIIEEH